MFFKKNQNTDKTANAQTQNVSTVLTQNTLQHATNEAATPVYQKPVLRRYDQIDQVKPYGPSEI
jgi:hypothetical protein